MSSVIVILTISYFVLGLLLFLFQRSFLYFPQLASANVFAPEVSFKHGEQDLTGWVLNADKPEAIIYYGGNAESIEQNIPFYLGQFSDKTTYLIPYRGYGKNNGEPTESSLYSDALFIFDKLKNKHNKINIVGRSLGSGVATYVAANREIDKLVLITPYDSIENIAKKKFPMFPMFLLVKDKFLSYERAVEIHSKTLILSAEHDQTIPLKNTEHLASQFDSKILTQVLIENADHNNILGYEEYKNSMRLFLN
jgi:pimeloyl-ACP methyl ester carboxylesterase